MRCSRAARALADGTRSHTKAQMFAERKNLLDLPERHEVRGCQRAHGSLFVNAVMAAQHLIEVKFSAAQKKVYDEVAALVRAKCQRLSDAGMLVSQTLLVLSTLQPLRQVHRGSGGGVVESG